MYEINEDCIKDELCADWEGAPGWVWKIKINLFSFIIYVALCEGRWCISLVVK